jgi:hypothetical protein
VESLIDRLTALLETTAGSGSDGWNGIRAQLAELNRTLRRAADAPQEAADQAIALLSALRESWETLAKGSGRPLLGGGDDDTSPAIGPLAVGVEGPPGHRGGAAIIFGSVLDPYATALREAEATVWQAKLQQTIIVGLLFMVWALATYSPTFDGTWVGLATVFFSVFSVDIAVDSLLTKMKR